MMEMESTNKSLISLFFVAAGFLVFLVVSIIFETLAGTFGVVARLHGQELFRHGIPVGLGVIAFGLLNFHPKIQLWAEEVVTEVQKVVWPARKDVVAMTMVVCVMVILAGIAFGIFDFAANQLMKIFLK